MLSEEALVLYAVAGACALLILGVLELVAPTRPRHPQRRVQVREPLRRARTTPAPTRFPARGPAPATESATPGSSSILQEATPGPAPVPGPDPPIERWLISQAEGFTARIDEPARAAPVTTPAVGAGHDIRSADGRAPEEPPLVDRCLQLYESGRFTAVIGEAGAALDTASAGALPMDPRETARLWGIVALARQAIGERDGARAAFEEALAVAPDDDRATWRQHLAALALDVGQDLATQAQSTTADPEARVTTLHSALTWLESGVAAAPDDPPLRTATEAARTALWPTYEQAVAELLQRQEFQAARRVLRQALHEEDCPAELQSAFREMLVSTHSGEVGQLTAEAIKRMQEGRDEEALATLDRAEEMLEVIPDGGLPAKRRHELERRLWWSYTKVGLRRVDAGQYEDALPPLLHALDYDSVGAGRRQETKAPLIRALEGVLAARSPLIERMTAEGDGEGALALCEKFWATLSTALERGVTKEELVVALTGAQSLFEKLGKAPP